MANNRIYLRCKQCGETLFLGKCGLSEYYWQFFGEHQDTHLEDELNDFFKKHCFCEKELDKDKLKAFDTPLGKYTSWDTMFEIAYEFEHEYDDDEE